jgi:hypothetical protein
MLSAMLRQSFGSTPQAHWIFRLPHLRIVGELFFYSPKFDLESYHSPYFMKECSVNMGVIYSFHQDILGE